MNDFPGSGDYDPKDKFLSTTARMSAVPIFKDGEDRFLDDKAKKYVPAPNSYKISTPKAKGTLVELDKQSSARFVISKELLERPGPEAYSTSI